MPSYNRLMALVGERKALAAAVLAFYMILYFLIALAIPPDEGFRPFFSAMGALYGTAFFSLVAGYFWARWFSIGLGIYGLIIGIMALWTLGVVPELIFLAATHGLVSLALWGGGMAAHFDGKTEWRARFHLDESGTQRLGKAVIRVGISLPFIIAYGLSPRADMDATLLCAGIFGLVALGSWGLLRLRTWGIVVLVAGSAAVLGTLGAMDQAIVLSDGTSVDLSYNGAIGGGVLLLAALPFAGPIARYLKS